MTGGIGFRFDGALCAPNSGAAADVVARPVRADGCGGHRLSVCGIMNHADHTSRLPQRILRTQQVMRLHGTRRRERNGIAVAGHDVDGDGRHRQPSRVEHGMVDGQHVVSGRERVQLKASRGVAPRHQIGAFNPDLGAFQRSRPDQAVEHHAAQHTRTLSGSEGGGGYHESQAEPGDKEEASGIRNGHCSDNPTAQDRTAQAGNCAKAGG